MADALVIDFEITGSSKIETAFARIGKLSDAGAKSLLAVSTSADLATTSYRLLNDEIERFNRLVGQGGGGPSMGRGGYSSPSGSSLTSGRGRSSGGTMGPFQRQGRLSQELSQAHAAGDTNRVLDVQLAQGRNDKQIAQALSGPKGLGSRFMDVLKTSRFGLGGGAGGGLMPLVGKSMALVGEALGPGLTAVLGPLGLIATVGVLAAKSLVELASSAAASGAAYNKQAYELGTKGAVNGQIGALAGVNGAQQAKAYNEAISSGGLGQYAGMREGQSNFGGPLNNKIDIGTQYYEGMERRRHMSFDDQERQARMTNTEDSMPLMSMSEKQWQIAKQQGIAQSKIMEGMGGPSTDYQQSVAGLSSATDNLKAALGAPLLGSLTDFENGLASITNTIASMFSSKIGKDALTAVSRFMPGPLGAIATALGGGGAAASAKDTALDRNTDSHDRNTAATTKLGSAMQGTFGVQDTTGRRAGAFPGSVGPQNPLEQRDFYAHGRQLGAF